MNGFEKKKPVATNNRLHKRIYITLPVPMSIITSFHIKRKENR